MRKKIKLIKGEILVKKILVPIDGSDNSKLALEKAKELAKLTNGEIMIVTVVKDVASQLYTLENKDREEIKRVFTEQGEEVIKEAKELIKGCTDKIQTSIIQGDPAQEIIKMAEDGEYDLIIMGNRGLNAFSRVMIGSVSSKVLNHVKTSVLIVK